MLKLYLGNTEIKVLNGARLSRTSTEVLDTAELTTANIGKLNIKLFQDVFRVSYPFNNSTQNVYMLASTVSENRKTIFNEETTYQYTMSLISPTVLLKRIVLPNRSITKSLVGSNKSVYTVLKNFRDIYMPELQLNTNLQALLSMECPEKQWNKPTLYEVILDLFAVANMIPSVIYDVGNWLLVGVSRTRKTTECMNYSDLELNQSIEGTSDRLEIEAQNVYYDVANTKTPANIAIKTEDSAILEIENGVIILDKPIFTIKRVRVAISLTDPDEVISADITDKVVSKQQYELARISNSIGIVTGNYKRDRLYYIEGDNKIYGLNYDETSWIGSAQLAIVNILQGITGNSRISYADIMSMTFFVTYTTTDNVGFRVYKTFRDGNKSVLVDNQENSTVDIISLAQREQSLVDCLGGKQLSISGKYHNMGQAPQLSQFVRDYEDNNEEYILSEINYVFQNSFIDVVAKGIPHFVLKQGYTGIDMQKRYNQLAEKGQAFLSNHIEEVFLEFSTTSGNVDLPLERNLIMFGRPSSFGLPLAIVYASSKRFALHTSTYPVSNSIVINFRMRDNISAGETTTDNFGKLEMNYASYVDSNGELTSLSYRLYNNFVVVDESSYSTYMATLQKARALPVVYNATLTYNEPFLFYESDSLLRYKDNREITMETIQFFFLSNADVVIGDLFFSNHSFFVESSISTFYIYASTDEIYGLKDRFAKGNLIGQTNIAIVDNSIEVVGYNFTPYKSWAIADSNGNLFFGVNGKQNKIYLKKRSSV